MNATRFLVVLANLLVAGTMLVSCADRRNDATSNSPPPSGPPPVMPSEYVLTGPHTHENLSIFLLHGKDRLAGKTYLTLQEAMEQKKIIVHETGSVGELAVENVSDEEVYVQSGDIVKGGRQDRTLANDYIVQAKSGRLPVASFCVESGRWQRRASEQATSFSGSDFNLPSSSMKLAAKAYGDQGAVWESVAKAQQKLGSSAADEVRSTTSPSSLQLTMENRKVLEMTDQYVKALAGCIDGKSDVIGHAFAINGKIVSADVYGSNALFRKLWAKNLRSCAMEAVAELRKDEKFQPVSVEMARQSLTVAQNAKTSQKGIGARVQLITTESTDLYLFETRDNAQPATWIHRNYIQRDPAAERQMQMRQDSLQQRQIQGLNGPIDDVPPSMTPPTTQP